MSRTWNRFFYLILAALLSSCATLPSSTSTVKPAEKKQQIQATQILSWHINGKIAISTAQDSGSATVDWIQNHQQFDISLFGPLGMTALKLTGHPGLVMLKTADGKSYSASNPEELLNQQWGFRLPVSNLKYWIRGLPVPGMSQRSTFDSNQRLSRLNQGDWDIQYLSYTNLTIGNNSIDLPDRISITSPTFKTKIVIYNWNV